MFKLPMRASPVFVNEVFVERVGKAALRNVSFRPMDIGELTRPLARLLRFTPSVEPPWEIA